MPRRADHPDTPLVTGGVDAQVNARDGKVYLRKRCKEHGVFEALMYGDAQMYLDSARFNKPGTIPLQFQTEVTDGCPSDCGLCECVNPNRPHHKVNGVAPSWSPTRAVHI